jgi:hypothetical protein
MKNGNVKQGWVLMGGRGGMEPLKEGEYILV